MSTSKSSSTSKLLRSKVTIASVSSRGGLSSSAENALLSAATKKAELLCRARKLKEKLALEKKEFKLRQKKEILELDTEMEVEQAKIDVLEKFEEGQSMPDSQTDRQLEVKDTVQRWLDNADGATSAAKPEVRDNSTRRGYSLYGASSSCQTSESEIDTLASSDNAARNLSKSRSSPEVTGEKGVDNSHNINLTTSSVDQKPQISPTPQTASNKYINWKKHLDSQPHRDAQFSAPSQVQPLHSSLRPSIKLVVGDDGDGEDDDGDDVRKKKQPLTHQPSSESQKREQRCNEIHLQDDDGGHVEDDDDANGVHKRLVKKERKAEYEKTEESVLSNLATAMMDHQKKSSLPHRNMPTFAGDPLEYHSFMQAFKYGVENKTDDEMDKLYFLEQCTTGEPNRLVKGFLNRDASIAFKDAKRALAKKFGNKFVILAAFKEKAKRWPEVRREDRKAWSSFSIFLSEFVNTVSDMGCLQEVDHSETIKILLSKMPYFIKHQWRLVVYGLEEKEDRIAGFTDFVVFVEKQTRIINNPIYGDIDNSEKPGKAQSTGQKTSPKKASFATSTKEENQETSGKWCHMCEQKGHSIAECRKLQKMPVSERATVIKNKKLCFGCLKGGHFKKICTNKEKCQKCNKQHPTVLHDPDRERHSESAPVQKHSETKVNSGAASISEDHSNMTIVPVLIKQENSNDCIATYAFLDSGCNAVFANAQLCQAMNVRSRKRKLIIETLNSSKVVDTEVVLDKLQVGSVDGKTFIDLPHVYIKDSIPVSLQNAPTQEDLITWKHLSDIQLPQLPRGYPCIPEVSLMVGNNAPGATMPLNIATGSIGEPYAILTPLGWAVYGARKPVRSDMDMVSAHFCTGSVIKDGVVDLEQRFREYVNMDFNENLSDSSFGNSTEDKRFLKIVEDTTVFENGNYHIALPFRNDDPTMPDDKHLAQSRAENLKRKFQRDPKYHAEYKTAMDKVIQAGYAELVPDNDQVAEGKKWYVPHHGVRHPTKGKLRVVYDCAATYKGCSLNGELMQGPDLTNNLVGVLLRFRPEPVAILADIEAMFYQVKVKGDDCNFLRFLWWPSGNIDEPLIEYRMKVHIFGANSSPACANYALLRTAEDNKQHYSKLACDKIRRNFYVDDCLCAVPTVQDGISLAKELTSLCAEGGFKLTKWISNSKTVLETIPDDNRAESTRNMDLDSVLPSHRALGLLWSVETDCFRFSIDVAEKPQTRRGLLSVLSSVYDPLGLVSPAILPAKMILQDLCKQKVGWDETIPELYQGRWTKWVNSLPGLENIAIPRCFKPQGFEELHSIQVHHFSDASRSGYGTASYLRITNSTGDVECNLIMSKARVSPVKEVSIPRLELTAATVAVKVDAMLKREMELPVDQTTFWTDSETVLKYIKNERARYPVFVANRVSVIRDGSDVEQWRYVPTKLNPADHASRGLSVSQLVSLHQWLKGPDFLRESEDSWQDFLHNEETEHEVEEMTEETNTPVMVNAVVVEEPVDDRVQTNQDVRSNDTLQSLIGHYSDWTSLKRAVAWLLRLRQLLLSRSKGEEREEENKGPLTIEEIEQAECVVIKSVQGQHFPDEYHVLKDMQDTNRTGRLKKGSSLARLDPVLKDEMLCVGGRLRNAAIPEEAKHQIILPKNHPIVTLIIRHAHRSLKHQGRSHVLAEIRKKYWIIKAGVSIKKEIRRCVICRRVQATVGKQKMADLPTSRLQADKPPFTHTGLDYFGPFHIKQGRTVRKRYGVVFTCMASRAVHLEVAGSLETDACINAIRRFISRRGPVKEITSDNGSNLVGANEELRRAFKDLDQDTLQRFSTNNGIVWKFNPPASSHQGGVWERQIRTIRKILNAILLEQHLKTCRTEEELHTFLCEVESIINSRPLTRATDDPADMDVITPKDLLLLVPGSTPPPGCFNERDTYARRRWRQVQYLAEVFWKRWTREYLPTLQERQKWLQPERNLQVGDVVLVVDDRAPRSSWLMGRVQEVFIGNQGLVRSASIKTKGSVLTRPVTKLCLLLEQES